MKILECDGCGKQQRWRTDTGAQPGGPQIREIEITIDGKQISRHVCEPCHKEIERQADPLRWVRQEDARP